MGLWKSVKKIASTDNYLYASIILLMLPTFTLSQCVDWGTFYDDLSAVTKAHMEDCVMASRTAGPDWLTAHPECRDVVPPNAKTSDPH